VRCPLFPARWTPAHSTERDGLRSCNPSRLLDSGDDGAVAIIDNPYSDRSAVLEIFVDQMGPAIARVLNHARAN